MNEERTRLVKIVDVPSAIEWEASYSREALDLRTTQCIRKSIAFGWSVAHIRPRTL